jgi:hypothetical protein
MAQGDEVLVTTDIERPVGSCFVKYVTSQGWMVYRQSANCTGTPNSPGRYYAIHRPGDVYERRQDADRRAKEWEEQEPW